MTRERSRLILAGHETYVQTIAWSPDGKSIVSGDRNGRLLLWPLPHRGNNPTPFQTIYESNHSIQTVTWSPNGQQLAFNLDQEALILDIATSKVQGQLDHGQRINSIAWSPNGIHVALDSGSKNVTVWDVTTGEQVQAYHFAAGGIGQELAWSPDGNILAYNVGGGHFIFWDVTMDQQTVWKVDARTGPLSWSPNGRYLAYHGIGTVGILDSITGKTTQELIIRNENVEALAWSPDGERIAAGTSDGTVIVWQVASGRVVRRTKEHSGIVWAMSWAPDGQQLVSGSGDGQVIIWSGVD